MDNSKLMPQAAKPVNRITTGVMPDQLAELSEETLSLMGEAADLSTSVLAAIGGACIPFCSYDGDDAE